MMNLGYMLKAIYFYDILALKIKPKAKVILNWEF